MKKRIFFAVVGVLLVIAALAGVKALQIKTMIDGGKKFVPPPETVTTAVAKSEIWDSSISSTGSLTAVQGGNVTAEVGGKIVKIFVESGAFVKKGDPILQQDSSLEEAQLPGAVAQLTLNRSNLKRTEQLLKDGIISQADYDLTVSNSTQAQSQVDSINTTIGKKTVRAPFSGRLGIREVNLGQMLREGDKVFTLQTVDPIYVDFSLPQHQLQQVRVGLPIKISADVLGNQTLTGKITAITSLVDPETRNVKIRGTVSNRSEKLRPGMYVNVSVAVSQKQNIMAIPSTSVLYAPYGDSVFILEDKKDQKTGKSGFVVRQQFVKLGEKRGDFVAVTSGLKEGEQIVSTGVFKLRNGQSVVADNKLSPNFQYNPKPENN